MDYTLAQYRPEAFETLVHELTVDKLVQVLGYPQVSRVPPYPPPPSPPGAPNCNALSHRQ